MEELAACPPGPSSDSPVPYDIVHEREFYKYYQPLSLGLANQTPYQNHAGPASGRARASPDRTITAFAQLATLRLDCRRAFISFFDRKYQYIIAEATRSLSLSTDCDPQPGEEMRYGVTIVPKKGSICEHTVAIPCDTTGEDKDASVFTIEDLREDERFKNREYTKGDFVFYAGAPIISPNGIKIGAFCVIDDKPRKGLSPDEVSFLKDIATTTMVHMDMIRARAESLQGERMVRGLGSFVEGKSSLEDWLLQSNDKDEKDANNSIFTTNQQWADQQYSRHRNQNSQVDDDSSSSVGLGLRLEVEQSVDRRGSHASSEECLKPMKEDPKAKKTSQVDTLPVEVKHTFGRASCIIREALKIDAVCCFDAKAGGTFGGLVDPSENEGKRRKLSSSEESDSNGSHADSGNTASAKTLQQADTESDKPCEILGFSTTELSSINGNESVKVTDGMTETYLRALLRRYPQGRIMTFDEQNISQKSKATPDVSNPESIPSKSVTGSTKKRKRLRTDEAKLRKMFPRVRSLAIVPMYDSRHQLFSAFVAWTIDPTRVLTHESELSYLAAFAATTMAETARITASKSDKAKGDFISSISHELRSPLHGILGSVDLLQDSALDPFQENLVHTVETCGKTLLDTVDHLLDFSKINNFARKNQRRTQDPNSDGKRQSFALDVDVDLGVITEEVLETVFAGHDFVKAGHDLEQLTEIRKSVEDGSDNPGSKRAVSVIVDIDKAQDSHWVFRTQAGAWRRILMNLFGNSLKYTERGFVQVLLKAEPLPEKHKTGLSKVTLIVRDSGKGISQEYLDTQLFTPFAQEDSLQPGTGLGLAITATIIRSMGGDIVVKSEQGKGTDITVTMEMQHAPLSQESLEQSIISTAAKKLDGLKIGFVGFEADCFKPQPKPDSRSPENAYYLFMNSFSKLCRNWFGMEMKIMYGLDESDADVFLTTEVGLDQIQDQLAKDMEQQSDKDAQNKVADTPLLVVTNSVAAANAMMNNRKSHIAGIISQPCGPRKLAKALTLSLESFKASKDPDMPTPTVRRILDQGIAAEDDSDTRYTSGATAKESKSKGIAKANEGSDTGINEDISISDPPLKHPQQDVMQLLQGKIQIPAHGGPRHTGSISLPALPAASSSMPPDKPRRNVLLVDDNKINLQLLVTYMKKSGHSFKTASNGLEAFEVYKTEFTSSATTSPEGTSPPFDFILMDLTMPVMDGLESARCIRGFERENGVRSSKVIALTGLASASAQQEAFGSGINTFMTKPVKLKELSKILETEEDN